jgi:hypothetical protein
VQAILESELREPRSGETALRIQVSLFFGSQLVYHTVDESQRFADRHGGTVRLHHTRIAREDAHPRTDHGLIQVNGRDALTLERLQMWGELGSHRHHDL